jgi:cation diffusion facilitator family transporter
MKLSFVLSILYVITDVTIAVMTDSMTILLDGLYGVADIAVSFLAIFVISKVNEPPNERYHFGYAKYEPFMTALEGILITAVCVSTVTLSIQDIVHPDPVERTGLIVVYTFINTLIGLGFGFYMLRVARKTKSNVIRTDSDLWIIGGVISLAVCIAFYLTGFMTRRFGPWYANYVDPVLCITLAIIFMKRPIDILRESFFDLVDANPHKEVRADIDRITELCREKYNLSNIKWLKLRKAGRKVFVFICFIVESQKSLKDVDSLKRNIVSDLNKEIPYIDLWVFFEC